MSPDKLPASTNAVSALNKNKGVKCKASAKKAIKKEHPIQKGRADSTETSEPPLE